MANYIFDDDDRAIDHHAEIERAQGQQVRRNFVQVEANGGEEQRERNGQGDNQRAARIAQEKE